MSSFIYFSFLQGMLAFFAPCAVALLPAYIVSFVTRNKEDNSSKRYLLLRGIKLASLSIGGILLIYSIAGILIVFASQLIKDYMKWVAISMGVILIIIGMMALLGKNIALNIHMKHKKHDNEVSEAFFFGIAYAIGALGCLFPLFLIVATQAISEPNMILGASYILAYFAGISLLMITTIVGSIFAKDRVMKLLRGILPHMNKITGILLIVAGIYIINYQMILV